MAMFLPDPFDTLFEFQQALQSLKASGWLGQSPSAGGAYPPINVFRKGEDIVILAEVPGIRKEDLDIQVKGRTLRIAGSKAIAYGEKASLHRGERLEGRFDRAVSLPVEIDAAGVKAECRDGILALFLPRAEHDRPRSISIG